MKNSLLHGDGAKEHLAEDRFDLGQTADSIATLLTSRVAADGYTIGIEGEWGSGKTTLTNFIVEIIEKEKSRTHKILRFDPWLIGNRDVLIHEFFTALLIKIAEFRSDSTLKEKISNEQPKLLENLISKIEKYRELLDSGANVVATVAPFDATQHAHVVAILLKSLGFIAKGITSFARPSPLTLEQLRAAIKDDLRALEKLVPGTRFIVIIDDLDRLDPEESIESLRLIRAVADFPLLTYLVCFDRNCLAKQVRRTIGVGNGHDYLEKIFQNILSLPPQEPFALRRMVSNILAERFPDEFSYSDSAERRGTERRALFFDRWVGRFVLTPRDVARLCDAVTFGWPYIQGRADFIDYAWLQLLKIKCPELYKWTRDYVVNLGSLRDGGRPGDNEAEGMATELVAILKKAGWSNARGYPALTYFLPGVKGYVDSKKPKVLDADKAELAIFEQGKRLGSPSHWRWYFAFGRPSYALDDDDLQAFRSAVVRDVAKATEIVRRLIARQHANPGHLFNVFLERLFDARESLTPDEQIGMARTFGDVMDDIPENPRAFFSLPGPWTRAESILGPAVGPHFAHIARTGAAINWICDALRTQGIVLGRNDPSRKRGDLQWLSNSEFDEALSIVLDRVREMGIGGILQRPQPLTILYCWKQLGNAAALGDTVQEYIKFDENFILFLDGLRGWVDSSERGLYRSLQSRNVSEFLDLSIAYWRLNALIDNETLSTEQRARIREIFSSWDITDEGIALLQSQSNSQGGTLYSPTE